MSKINNNYASPLKLGNITLPAPFFQAALSGYTDRAMRVISRRFGCPLSFSGLMLAKSASHRRVLEMPQYTVHHDDHPVGGQLLGSDPAIMAQAARNLQEFGYDLIDLNFACPAPKVVRRGRGGYLLNDPARIKEICHRVRQAVSCPVIMKLRIGYDHSCQGRDNFYQICRQADHDGIDALIIHGRTVQQRYRDRADWNVIAEVKRQFPSMTIIGSGDLFTPTDIADRLAETTVDGVAIARGSIGNPWIFPQALAMIQGKQMPPNPDIPEQGRVISQHFDLITKLYDTRKAIIYFRKFSIYYCKHHPERKKVQHDLLTATTIDQVQNTIKLWYGREYV